MKFFGRGKRKPQETQPSSQSVRCSHPVSHQIILREDPSKPNLVTGTKCTQCGERLSVGKTS